MWGVECSGVGCILVCLHLLTFHFTVPSFPLLNRFKGNSDDIRMVYLVTEMLEGRK